MDYPQDDQRQNSPDAGSEQGSWEPARQPGTPGDGEGEAEAESGDLQDFVRDSLARLGEPPAWSAALDKLANVPASAVTSLFRQVAEEAGARSLAFLQQAAGDARRDIALGAVNALGFVVTEDAAALLADIGEKATDRDVRKAAKRSLFRLRSKGLTIHEKTATSRTEEAPRHATVLFSALASQIDAYGDRLFDLGVETPGGIEFFTVMTNERAGVAECQAMPMGRRRFFRERAQRLAERDLRWIELPPDYAKFLLQEAYQKNLELQTGVPVEFLRWQKIIAQAEQVERPIIYDEISLLEVKWNPALLKESPQILREPETLAWGLLPEELADYVRTLEAASRPSSIVLTERTAKDREEKADATARERFFGGARRAAWKRRLEETAYLFIRTERPLQAKRALAAAVALGDPSVSLADHPLVSAMLEMDLEAREMDEQRRYEEEHRRGGLYLP